MPLVLGCEGVERSTSTNGSLLILLEPLIILLFAWLLLGERIAGAQVAGVFVGIAGAVVLILDDGSASIAEADYLSGNLLLAASAVAWGIYTPLAKPLLERHDPFAVTFATMIVSLVVLGPYAWTERASWPSTWTWEAVTVLLILGVLISLIGTCCWVASLEHIPASWVAPFLLVQPLAGTLGGILWLKEEATDRVVTGGLMIMAGLAVTIVAARRRRVSEASSGST